MPLNIDITRISRLQRAFGYLFTFLDFLCGVWAIIGGLNAIGPTHGEGTLVLRSIAVVLVVFGVLLLFSADAIGKNGRWRTMAYSGVGLLGLGAWANARVRHEVFGREDVLQLSVIEIFIILNIAGYWAWIRWMRRAEENV